MSTESESTTITEPQSTLSPEEARLPERVQELERLIRLISMRPEITFQVGEPNSPWYFEFNKAIVNAPINDLLDRSMDYCRGLALHEAAHATVTRIFDMLRTDLFSRREIHSLFNVIEDCRIETWMLNRSPGCAPWVRLYNDRLFAGILHGPPLQSHAAQFNMSILSKWWFGEYPSKLAPQVWDALKRAMPAIERAIGAQPPSFEAESEIIRRAYEGNRTLRFSYMRQDLFDPPSYFEMLVRIRQLQMVHIVLNEVLPIFLELFEDDNQKGRGADKELQRMLQNGRGHHTAQPSSGGSGGQPRPGAGGAQASRQFGNGGSGVGANQAIQEALRIDPRDKYLTTWMSMGPEIDLLSEQLIRVFQLTTRMRWLRGYPSGARLDIREAMSFEADPRRYNILWQRKSQPKRIEPAFVLLLDRSGSMNGENIEGAFKGLVLVSEVCARLSVPFAVFSFSDSHRQVHSHEDTLDEAQRSRLGSLANNTNGGTQMGNALASVYEYMHQLPQKDRCLIVLSDGLPNNGSLVKEQVRRLENNGVTCIGLGVGAGTEQLEEFFPTGLFEVTPTTIAEELAGVIRYHLIESP